MESVSIRELFCNTRDYTGKTVTVSGWVRSVRASKAFGFIVLHDGTFFLPCRWYTTTIWKISRKFPR
mgnify:CR=1 FL=1